MQEIKNMSTKEVCEILDISHDTLRRMRVRGQLSPLPGNPLLLKAPLRYDRSEVLALLPSKAK
jgi:predicted site-specific integrase-resolvase